MANEMVNNLQNLTDGVDTLTQKVNELYDAVARVKGVAASAITDIRGSINTMGGQYGLGNSGHSQMPTMASFSYAPAQGSNGQNFLDNSMGDFSGGFQGEERSASFMGQIMSASSSGGGGQGGLFANITGLDPTGAGFHAALGGVKMAAAGAVGMMGMMPDVGLTIQRDIGYYQAALRTPGISRGDLQRSTLAAMGHSGLSSIGSDAIVAPLLASRGYVPGSANFTQAAAEVGGAFRYLGMENGPAAQAIAGLHSGPMGANLYQYGVDTYDAATGKQKSTGDIAKELYGKMFQKGATAEDVQNALLMGNAGANLRTMGFTEAQQAIFSQMFVDIASGRDPDLATAAAVGDNKNTSLDSIGEMNVSQTELMQKGTGAIVAGFHAAAMTVNAFNEALEPVVPILGAIKGFTSGVMGSNIGQGLVDAAPIIASAASDFLTAAELFFTPGGGSSGFGARGLGGSTSGYGASIGGGGLAIGGGAPVNGPISAGYGAKSDSGIWSSTNGSHTGVDYQVPIGTPVKSYMEGVVSSISPGADYGTAVVIDHPNGYQTLYGHLSSRDVNLGQTVAAGQRIGKSGKSGNTTGPHLHYEVRRGKNNPVNPSELTNSKYVQSNAGELSSTLGSLRTAGLLTLNQAFASASTSSSYSSSGSPTGDPNKIAQEMHAWLISQGLSANGAFGVVANLMAESGMKTNNPGDKGTSNGIAQWHDTSPGKGRLTNLLNFARDAGLDPYSLEAQKQFLMKELNNKGYKDLMSILRDPNASQYDTTAAFMRRFERPKDQSDEAVTKRLNRGLGALTISGGGSSGFGASIASAAVGPQGNTTINITLKIDKASDEEAARFAKKVKEYLHNDSTIAAMGSR
jgi:murein DD-endopeptidase MepM/ murein hydrolase activator NlpD